MDPLSVGLLTFLTVAGATFAAGALLLRWLPAVRPERLSGGGSPRHGDPILMRWDTARARWQRLIERLGAVARPRNPAKLTKYQQRLAWAGYHDPRAVAIWAGSKIALGLVFLAIYPLGGLFVQRLLPNVMVFSIGLGLLGFLVPDLWLKLRTRGRQEKIVNALPDVLDLLMVCVEAGMGFDAALARVVEQPEGRTSPLHQEINRMNLEMRAGRSRQEALRALANRCGLQEITAMVSVFIQTDKLGTSMGKTLRVHAETSRVERRHRAEERAYLAPLKMIFPTIFFLMPAFVLVAMGPSIIAVISIIKAR
jgi:tight adherence protein C